MSNGPYHTDDEIREALAKFYGQIKPAADYLNMERESLYSRLTKNPELRKYQHECGNALNELAVSKLVEAIKNGEAWAIALQLKAKGGYSETLNVNTTNLNLDIEIDLLEKLSIEELKLFNEQRTKLLASTNPE